MLSVGRPAARGDNQTMRGHRKKLRGIAARRQPAEDLPRDSERQGAQYLSC
jgi:hypothetical protein